MLRGKDQGHRRRSFRRAATTLAAVTEVTRNRCTRLSPRQTSPSSCKRYALVSTLYAPPFHAINNNINSFERPSCSRDATLVPTL
jgi:hypothetical protein